MNFQISFIFISTQASELQSSCSSCFLLPSKSEHSQLWQFQLRRKVQMVKDMQKSTCEPCWERLSIAAWTGCRLHSKKITKRNQNCLFCIFRWSSKYVLIIKVRMSVANLHTPAISPHCTPWHACLHPTYVYHVYYIYSIYVHMYVGHHLPDIYASLCISMHLYALVCISTPRFTKVTKQSLPPFPSKACKCLDQIMKMLELILFLLSWLWFVLSVSVDCVNIMCTRCFLGY